MGRHNIVFRLAASQPYNYIVYIFYISYTIILLLQQQTYEAQGKGEVQNEMR